MRTLFIKLSSIDRRIIFLFISVAVILPLVFPLNFPTKATTHTKALYNIIEQLPPNGNPILISFDYGPSVMPECHPMAYAILRHAFARNIRVVGLTLANDAAGLAEFALTDVAKEFGKKYGEDYVFLGYKPGGYAVILSIGEDIKKTFPQDYYGKSTTEIPLLSYTKNYNDIPLVVCLSGSATATSWIVYAGARYQARVADGVTAVIGPELYPFLQTKQLSGLLIGLKGASEYEHLVTHAGIFRGEKRASRGMDALSTMHLVIIAFIIFGNIGYFLTKKGKKT